MEKLTLRFKDMRDYLHGTDIFDAMTERYDVRPPLTFQLKAVARHQITVFSGESAKGKDGVIGRLTCVGASWIFVEDPDRAVTASYPYDEDAVCGAAEAEGDAIKAPVNTAHSFIELTVALQKRLLKAVAPEVKTWWFVQLQLKEAVEDPKTIELTARNPLVHRLALSDITIDGKAVGSIGFTARS